MAVYTYVQTLIELLLLLIDYAKAKVDFVGLLKIWLHAHDLRECLFGMLKGSIAIVEDSYAIPKLGFLCIVSVLVEKMSKCKVYLRVGQVVEGLLVSRVSLLQVVHHQIAVT
jgi:hypothetical protein